MDSRIAKILENHGDAHIDVINLPKGDEYVYNSRQQKIHVQTLMPKSGKPKFLVVMLHGYSAHSNQPWVPLIGREFAENDIAFVTFDFHGHGYSDGVRVDVEDYRHLIDDCLSVIFEVYRTPGTARTAGDSEEARMLGTMAYSSLLNMSGLTCPFVVSGMSLGGVTSLAVGLELQRMRQQRSGMHYAHLLPPHELQHVLSLFEGVIPLCPAIAIKLPHPLVQTVMEYLVVPCCPLTPVPPWLGQPDLDRRLVFKHDHFLEYAEKDSASNGGMTHAPLVRFRTGHSLILLTRHVQACLRDIQFPFLVFHDPQDKICLVEGTERLMREASTTPEHKRYVPVEEGLHGLLPNKTHFVVSEMIAWIEAQHARR
jgi:alpha-beta hydrolase superfamily lysophospholipase